MTVFPKVEIVTVGVGWTAGIIAQKLTAEGHRVVSIEAGGDRFANPDFSHNHDTLYHMLRTGLMFNLSKETWTWRPNPRAPSLPIRQFGSFHPGIGIGGAGVHWAAQTWHFYPSDFRYRSHHVERYGEERIPQDCTVQDWGITYEELEPYYDHSDYEIGLSGQTGNLNGTILEGGNPFEGARSRLYPLPPLVRSIPADMFSEAAQSLGYHLFPQPASILSRAYRDLSGRERGVRLLRLLHALRLRSGRQSQSQCQPYSAGIGYRAVRNPQAFQGDKRQRQRQQRWHGNGRHLRRSDHQRDTRTTRRCRDFVRLQADERAFAAAVSQRSASQRHRQ